jgi:hypothetical protein
MGEDDGNSSTVGVAARRWLSSYHPMNDTMQLIACSGPGAGVAITKSVSIGYASAGLTAVLVIRMIVLSRRHPLPLFPVFTSVILLLLHPAWTVSAVRGDCGEMKRIASYAVLAVVLFLSMAVRKMVKRSALLRN